MSWSRSRRKKNYAGDKWTGSTTLIHRINPFPPAAVGARVGVEQHAVLRQPLHPRQLRQGGQGDARPRPDHHDR